jgi:hypothetical protein
MERSAKTHLERFDMEFVVSGFVPTRQGSWGALKVIYR